MKVLRKAAGARVLACWLACCFLATALPAGAADDDPPDFKLTAGHYQSSDGNPATDLNLRGSLGATTGWLGVYQDRDGLRQWRSGFEWHRDGQLLRTVWSLQNASGGAWVGSINNEVGGDTFAIVGFGRTNVRPYVNLNYDPNDAITLGIGSRATGQTELSLFQVRDDRLHTGQRITHAVLRRRFEGQQRLTLDLFDKRGLVAADGPFVHGRSWSLGYDRGALFMRFTHDPYAGFTLPTQNRLSFGSRF